MTEVWGGSLDVDETQVFPPKGKNEGNVKCTFPWILPHLKLNTRKKENKTWLMSYFLKNLVENISYQRSAIVLALII